MGRHKLLGPQRAHIVEDFPAFCCKSQLNCLPLFSAEKFLLLYTAGFAKLHAHCEFATNSALKATLM